MNKTKLLPLAAAALAIPGIGLRALHLLNGFDVDSGLPTAGSPWVWVCAVFFVLCAVLYGVLAAPLRDRESVPFEKLLGTDHALFRMTAVIAGLLLFVTGVVLDVMAKNDRKAFIVESNSFAMLRRR